MLRSLRTAVSFALLSVLMGGPLVTAICAEWCAPSGLQTHTRGHHRLAVGEREVATATQIVPTGCHGEAPGRTPRMGAHSPQCLDYALSGKDARRPLPRLARVLLMSPAPATVVGLPSFKSLTTRSLDLASASPPRPLAASPVLRI